MMKAIYFQIIAFILLSVTSAIAEEKRSPPGLPGVEPQKPIVSAPPPEPEPDQQRSGTWKNFRVGNTDVLISGDIRIDAGTNQGRLRR